MKLKFDPSLAYQTDAINAVIDLFDGQPMGQSSFEISSTLPVGTELTRHGIGNSIQLDDGQLLANTPLHSGTK